ncbi:MAG: hypothetical protein ACXQTX_04950 [Candidatus Syntropharchaeia archaeon]
MALNVYCGKYFNNLTNTIFEHHKFPIEEIYITAGEKGIKQDRPRRRGLRRRGRGTYEGDKPPVQTFTERRGKTKGLTPMNIRYTRM